MTITMPNDKVTDRRRGLDTYALKNNPDYQEFANNIYACIVERIRPVWSGDWRVAAKQAEIYHKALAGLETFANAITELRYTHGAMEVQIKVQESVLADTMWLLANNYINVYLGKPPTVEGHSRKFNSLFGDTSSHRDMLSEVWMNFRYLINNIFKFMDNEMH